MGVNLGTILREQHTLRMFENMVLRKIFGPQREEVTESRENYASREAL
jgi:hypothetical protein